MIFMSSFRFDSIFKRISRFSLEYDHIDYPLENYLKKKGFHFMAYIKLYSKSFWYDFSN